MIFPGPLIFFFLRIIRFSFRRGDIEQRETSKKKITIGELSNSYTPTRFFIQHYYIYPGVCGRRRLCVYERESFLGPSTRWPRQKQKHETHTHTHREKRTRHDLLSLRNLKRK